MAKNKGNAVSLSPEDFNEGGGLIDDIDVTFDECRFEMFDYQGKANPVPALAIDMSGEDLGDALTQYYSMGSSQDWIPSEDGSQLLAVGKATAIRMSTNGGTFLKALVEAGFPAEDLGDNITVLNGLKCHVIRVPEPERKGLKKSKEQQEREEKYGPKTILVVSEILAMPGEEKAAGKGKGKKAAAKKTTAKKGSDKDEPATGDDDDLAAKAQGAVMEVLTENDGSIAKKSLPAALMKALKGDEDKNAIIKLAFDDAFLGDGPWEYEDGTLTLG